MFVVNSPAGVQHVMVGNGKNYRKSPGNTQMLKPLLGNTNLRKVRKIGSRMVPLGDIMPLKGTASDGRYSVYLL